jgi:predicted nuclease with TOPRIM domain
MAGENANDQAAQLLNETQKKLQESHEANAALVQENTSLKTANAFAEKKAKEDDKLIADLQQEVAVLNAVNDELSAKLSEVSTSEKTVADHVKEAAALKAPVVPEESFSVDGKEYVFVMPVFQHKHQRVTAEAALHDQDLLAHLVKIKSGLIKEK